MYAAPSFLAPVHCTIVTCDRVIVDGTSHVRRTVVSRTRVIHVTRCTVVACDQVVIVGTSHARYTVVARVQTVHVVRTALFEPGEVISCDGVFVSGHSTRFDKPSVTGEWDAIKTPMRNASCSKMSIPWNLAVMDPTVTVRVPAPLKGRPDPLAWSCSDTETVYC
ncbi:hypothetical protein BJY52DRAFT_1229619 [Lactarius psammicola]|nr:hypothetical protein BJY52DRAFT_1229619 [Lactarius psammicola]